MTGKMDVKPDDLSNINIDPTLWITDTLGELNLVDSYESYEIPKSNGNSDAENDPLLGDIKITETGHSKCPENCAVKSSTAIDKSCTKAQVEVPSRNIKRKKDINGNEEPSSVEHLSQLVDKLELSDSDNEEVRSEVNDSLKLKERAPIRPRGRGLRPHERANKNRDQNRNEGYDRSQFNSERLLFWAGSKEIQSNETTVSNQFAVHNNLTSLYIGNEHAHTLFNQDSFYEDVGANSVGSPESGYDSSAQSSTGSPPPSFLSTAVVPDISQIAHEEKILDLIIEKTEALRDKNLPAYNLEEKDAKSQIDKIRKFLEDTPTKLCESSCSTLFPDNILGHVSIVDHPEDLNASSVSSPVSSTVSKYMKTPKNLVFKLDDKAKEALRKFLSEDEFFSAEKRIYKKVHEDIVNKKVIKVIYVEDEMDKASENRTNLHHAVLNSEIEDIFCLVEIQKQYNLPLADINIRDKYGKTALDYAIQNQMTLVVDYLKENTACQNVIVAPMK